MSDEIRPQVLDLLTTAVVNLDLAAMEQARELEPTKAEMRVFNEQLLEYFQLDLERSKRVLAAYEVAAPYLKAGATTWEDAAAAMTPADRKRFEEAWARLLPGDIPGS